MGKKKGGVLRRLGTLLGGPFLKGRGKLVRLLFEESLAESGGRPRTSTPEWLTCFFDPGNVPQRVHVTADSEALSILVNT